MGVESIKMRIKKLIWSRPFGSLKTFLKEAFENTYFKNVTFVFDDEITVKAHKFILCAASSFMKDILVNINDGDFFIHIDGYQNKIVKSLLELIYTGEYSTGIEEASEVKNLANQLQISNITEHEITQENKLMQNTQHENKKEDELIQNTEQMIKKDILPPTTTTFKTHFVKNEILPIFDSLFCPECQKGFVSKATLKNHYRSIHLQIKWKCSKCDKIYPLESSLRAHTKAIHEAVIKV